MYPYVHEFLEPVRAGSWAVLSFGPKNYAHNPLLLVPVPILLRLVG